MQTIRNSSRQLFLFSS